VIHQDTPALQRLAGYPVIACTVSAVIDRNRLPNWP
jgi:hypothetical protein